jgi:hypothetical protein
MKIISELTLYQFDAWSGAVETKNAIIAAGKENEFDSMIYDLYPNGMTDTELNDFLWFDEEYIFEYLGIDQEQDEEEE